MKIRKLLKLADQFDKALEDVEFSTTDVPEGFKGLSELPTYLPPKDLDIKPTIIEKSDETIVPSGGEQDPYDPRTWKAQMESDLGQEIDLDAFDLYTREIPKPPKVPVINQFEATTFETDPDNPRKMKRVEFDPSKPFEFDATATRKEFRKIFGIK